MDDKLQKIKETLKELEVYHTHDQFFYDKVNNPSLSTGSYLLNEAIGIDGYPEGKIIEIFGVDSSGKTTLALHALAECQKINKVPVYIDLENTINLSWAKKIGVDIDNLFIARPKTGEAVFELIKKLIETNKVDLIIVDSVPSIVPTFEFENNMEDQQMGMHARLMSKGLRIIQSVMINKTTTIIFINQLREKIGASSFIPMTTTTGGRALKYAAAVRIEVKRAEKIQDSSGKVVGFETKCIIVKNKYGAPMASAQTAIYFDRGFDTSHEIAYKLISEKIISKKGSWFEFENKNLAQGFLQLRNKIKTDPELRSKLFKLAFPNLTETQ